MKKSKIILLSTLVLLSATTSTLSAFASTNEINSYNQVHTTNQFLNQTSADSINKNVSSLISDDVIEIANNYVSFDESLNQFYVSPDINNALTAQEVNEVYKQVESTNIQLKEALANGKTEVRVVDLDGEKILNSVPSTRGAGVNGVKFYWNYAKIKISAGSLRFALQSGFAIGGIYAPARVVQIACAVLGVSSGSISHGIWFDYNYLTGVLSGNMGLQ